MKILILSPYTTGQKQKPDNPLRGEDCASPEHLEARIKELCGYNAEGWYHESRDYSAPAGEMFTGPLNAQLREGLKQIREHDQYGETTLDLYFPWYFCRVDGKKGPVNETDIIVPFDTAPLHALEVLEYDESGVPEQMAGLIDSYDLAFSLLRQDDIQSLQRVFEVERPTTLIFLLAPSQKHVVNEDLPNVHVVENWKQFTEKPSHDELGHEGGCVKRLCEAACRDSFHVLRKSSKIPSS